ncbi:MAG: IPT/TIG domain-containing protein [Myxococcales bacterium]|nr:IPT/TIG domain-containing protein [Myxococcales bacterium]
MSALCFTLLSGLLAGCGCGKPPLPPPEQDAGEDAGLPPEEDGGVDAGEPDAGPPPELKILKVLPPRGGVAGGTQVLITGSAFIRDFSTRGTQAKRDTTIKFGSNPSLDFQVIDDETIEAKLPPGKAGLTNVSIANPNGLFVCTGCFTYYEELYLTGIAPKEGPLRGGNEVVLDGQGFTPEVEVLFGGYSSPQVTLVSSKKLKVVAPRGQAADLVDVVVYNKNGVGSQRRVYRYYEDLRVTTVSPLTGPLGGGTQVIISGKGLEGATSVKFGSTAASFTVDSPTQITATAPPATLAGAVDLAILTPRDGWTVKGGFTYADASGAFALFGVFPHLGAAAGGDTVTATGQALDTPGLSFSVGGASATVLSASFSTAVLQTPPRGASPRKVDLSASDGTLFATLSGAFTYRLSLSDISPKLGPSSGGTAAALTGSALPPDLKAHVGALAAQLSGAPTESQANLLTPPGSGGGKSDLWAFEAADPENEALLEDAFTFEEPLSIGRAQPERGAIAGGTLITVLGAGFGEGTVVTFGQNRAKDVKVVDSHTLTCRTPRGEVGTVDVGVERLSSTDLLPGGFSYFDPRSISGGLSGGPLVGTLNVTVLDGTQGFFGLPVPLASVMLGIDAATPFQGLTDARGQITFSDPSLVKAQAVTVWKEGYESATVTSITSENLTVFIARTGGDGNPAMPPPGPPPSIISGRVTGFKAPRALTANESLEARVFVTQSSLYGGPPYRPPPSKKSEKWVLTADGAEYIVFSGAGLRAVYAVLGVKNKQTGQFEPTLMGIKRGITTSPDNPAVNQDIILDMHLDLTVPITIDSPINIPLAQGGTAPANNSVYAWLDLGAEGFIPNPQNWDTGTRGTSTVNGTTPSLSFPSFPRLDGSNFIFLNEAAGSDAYPVSYYFRRQPGDLSQGVTIGPMLPTPRFAQPTSAGLTGTISWTTEPGAVPNIHQVLILKPTMFGTVTLWSMVLPGSETQVVLPPPALQKLRDEEATSTLFAAILSSRSPKFSYSQWTYDSLSGVSWSSYTIAVSDPFLP